MSTRQRIQHRLLTVVLLGVLTSALSLIALVRILSVTTAQRLERAREAVTEEADKLASAPSQARREVVSTPTIMVIGMRGGYWDTHSFPREIPEKWRSPLQSAIDASEANHKRAIVEVSLDDSTLIVCAQPMVSDLSAWAGYLVKPHPYLRLWQGIVITLTMATALLVTTALHAVITVKRGATALNASIVSLADDLSAPIARPSVRELSDVADGVANLARRLVQSRQVQEQLARELAKQERLAALGRIVAGVAHEVRNPLASIKLRLDLAAATSPNLPALTENALANASAEITRLDRLVADLLVVAGRPLGPFKTIALSPLLRVRIETLQPWSASYRVVINTSGEAAATVDPDSLTRAIDNLLRNAVEASPPDAVVKIQVMEANDTVKIIVEDHGKGVSPERVTELFEPFFTTKPEGTGLGLAISRAIARAHGGDVTYARIGLLTRFELSVTQHRSDFLREKFILL